jgi:hypothetical protein
MANPNPNEPTFPYGAGTDNPGDDTSQPGHGVQTETGAPPTSVVHPRMVGVIAQSGSDYSLPNGVQAVPLVSTDFSSGVDYGNERATDPGGPDATGREPGQDETAGETETTPPQSPAGFPGA